MTSTKVKLLETDKIVAFTGDIYSQWYMRDIKIDNLLFCCNEQWMMYCKAKHFKDEESASKILNTNIPKEHKDLGRNVKNFNDEEWNKVADEYVYIGNYNKFKQNEDLKEKLLKTGDKIIAEAAHYDRRWGTGYNIEDTINTSYENWGENRLGKALMMVRETIREE